MPIKQIAARLGVSAGSVSLWVRDVEISEEHRRRNASRSGRLRGDSWRELNRQRRRAYQAEGRLRAQSNDPLHIAACMLYWAEGSKDRNSLILANSDPGMIRFFCWCLRSCFHLSPSDFTVRLNVYTSNGLSIEEIEDHWLGLLQLPRACLRKHSLNHFPTSSSGRKKNRLPYGVCTLKVRKSTHIVQHIFGAIQEYGGFEEPRWLD